MAIRVKLVDKLKAENVQLRDAARQLLAGLTEYAKAENWQNMGGNNSVWVGEGDGPATARKFLGLDQEGN